MPERLFPLSFFATAASHAAALGVSADPVFARAGIPAELMADPDALITASQWHEMAVAARNLFSGDPSFELHLGELARMEAAEIVGPLYLTAPTLRAALLQCVRFMPLVTPCLDAVLEESGDEALYHCRVVPALADDFRFLHAEATLAITWAFIRRLTGRPDAQPRRIELRHDGSARAAEFHRIFGANVELRFNAGRDVTVFDRALLDLPNPGSAPTVHRQMETLAQARLARIPTVETFSTAVLRMLEEHTGQRVLDLDELAALMNVTGRTLQRRLREENTSFQKLRDGLRYRQAQTMLRDPALDVASIAAMLGFSEPTTFYRAFKAWSGLSPAEFRRRVTGPGAGAPTGQP